MIDQNFCDMLEYRITEAVKYVQGEEAKGFWCDGIMPSEPDSYYSKTYAEENRQFFLKAFFGKDGQTEYRLIVKLGNLALDKYLNGEDLEKCIPETNKTNWLSIDLNQKEIKVQLK